MEFRQVIRNKKLIIFANCLKPQQGKMRPHYLMKVGMVEFSVDAV